MHIEGSVYMSRKPLSATKIAHLINRMKKKYPYLTKCIRNMHQADISNIHSLEHHFEYDGTPGIYAKEKDISKDTKQRKKSTKQKNKSR